MEHAQVVKAVGGICPGEGTLGGILVHLCSSNLALTQQTCTISSRTPRIHWLHILAFSLTRLELAPVYPYVKPPSSSSNSLSELAYINGWPLAHNINWPENPL